MTVSTTTNRLSYAGNGITTLYTAPRFQAAAHLKVILRDNATGLETTQTITTHYTVTGPAADYSGSVTMATAPALGKTLVIINDPPMTQEVDPVENDTLPVETVIEKPLDKLTFLVQRLADQVSRKLGLSDGAAGITLTLPVPSAGKALKWNSGANAIENSAYDPDTLREAAEAAAAAAEAAQAAAETAQTNAETAETNAEAAETNAETAATNAQQAADSVIWNDVVFLTSANSPKNIVDADKGKMFVCDCTGGAITINLPQISGLTLSLPWSIAVKKSDAGANLVTINRSGTDTIDGAASKTLETVGAGYVLIPDTDPAPDQWATFQVGVVPDASITAQKLSTNAITGQAEDTAPDGTADFLLSYDASANALKKVKPQSLSATQVQQEASSTPGAFVSPARQHFHPSAAKAWVVVDNDTGAPSILRSYNVSSLTDNSSSNYTVNFSVSFSSANYAVAGWVYDSAVVNPYIAGQSGAAPSSAACPIHISNGANGSLDTANLWTAIFYGDL
jgi:hypothetical protein